MFRYHVNRLGRFSSPDPLAGSLANPQSLNRYSYVVSDPVNLTDPLGLQNRKRIVAPVYHPYPDFMSGGPRCEVDLVETSCGLAYTLLASGVAVACPGNDCTGIQVIGDEVYQWGPKQVPVFGSTCTGTWNDPAQSCSPLAFKGYTYILGLIPVGSVASWTVAQGNLSFG